MLRHLLQALQTDGLQFGADPGTDFPRRPRLILAHLIEGVQNGRPLEWRLAGEALVEDRPQGVDVGGGADLVDATGSLLRRHVAGRAKDGPGQSLAVGTVALAQSEVGHLGEERTEAGGCRRGRRGSEPQANGNDRPRFVLWWRIRAFATIFRHGVLVGAFGGGRLLEKDVGGLEVAVEDALLVDVVDGAGQHLDEAGGLDPVQTLAGQMLGQVAALGELQNHVQPAVVLAHLDDTDNVGVVELGENPGFIAETLELLVAGQGAIAQHLDGDDGAALEMPRLVDDAHAGAAQLR